MEPSPDVELWFAATRHPQEQALRSIREIILAGAKSSHSGFVLQRCPAP